MDCVIEGRDIGSVVFPKADFKFFLTADLDIRTTRRNKQIEENNISFDKKNLYFNIVYEEKIKKGIFLGAHWNYGHWMFNHLARLYYCQLNYKDNVIIVNNSIDNDKFKILKYFNISDDKIKIIKKGTMLNVEKLIIPQMPWHSLNGQTWWAPNSFNFIRKQIGSSFS